MTNKTKLWFCPLVDSVRIKTERVEDWMGAGGQQDEGGAVEEGTVMIDSSGRSTVVTATVGAMATRSVQPSSSFSETDR